MECQTRTRTLSRLLWTPALLLAFCLPVHADSTPAGEPAPKASAPAAKAKPAGKLQKKRSPRYSKATLSAFQPDPAQWAPKTDASPGPVPSAASLLSPVVQLRPQDSGADGDPLPINTEAETPLAQLMELEQGRKPSSKSSQLPSQEEGLALSRATAVPVAGDGGGVSDEAQAKVEKGVNSGPMNLRVKKQAVQMSVEIPLGSP